MNELVRVELIANPAVTRTMTMASYRNNANKWRISGAEQVAPPQPQKKNAEPAAVEILSISSMDGSTDFTNPTEVTTTSEPTGLVDGLRAQYKAQTGTDADKRWGIKKLSEEIKNHAQ